MSKIAYIHPSSAKGNPGKIEENNLFRRKIDADIHTEIQPTHGHVAEMFNLAPSHSPFSDSDLIKKKMGVYLYEKRT